MRLTPREQQIFTLLSSGKTYKEAGEYLGISINTIRTRVRILYGKLNAHSIAEAVVNYQLARDRESQDSDEQRETEKIAKGES